MIRDFFITSSTHGKAVKGLIFYTSGLSILIHGTITLSDVILYDICCSIYMYLEITKACRQLIVKSYFFSAILML